VTDPAALLSHVVALLARVQDIVDERVQDDAIPSWITSRGWGPVLLSMTDEQVALCESEGLAARASGLDGVPADLAELAMSVRALRCAVEVLPQPDAASPVRKASPRKRSQLAALVQACAPLIPTCRRVVDAGSGSGALAMELGVHFQRPVLGVEVVPGRVRGAQLRANREDVQFEARDAVAEGLGLCEGDLAVGLHACGQLGDTLIEQAIAAGAAVVLVTCCVQKIPGEVRRPLSRAGAGLALRRDILGLANLSPREQGVEAPTAQNMRARQARCALRLLLRSRGVPVLAGEEMRGVNRRAALRDFAIFAQAALHARGLPEASPEELHAAGQAASDIFARTRRLSLPRSMLGPVVELSVVLDRACALAEAGRRVRVVRLFDEETSPRNLAIIAQA
jgi:hypothetical protein